MSQLYARTPALYVQARRHPYAPWLVGLAILLVVGAVGGVAGAMLFHLHPNSTSANGPVPATTDVQLSGCDVDSKTGWPRASMVVTNSGSARASYVITVAFQSDDGKLQYGSTQTSVAYLAPGQKANAVAEGLDAAPHAFSCAVTSVNRQ